MRWLIIFIFVITAPVMAQQKPGIAAVSEVQGDEADDTDPFRDPGRTLPYLAYTLGQLHYLAYACEGDDTQEWRNRMIELLRLEAPLNGYRRERLIDAFNDGYQVEQQARIRCGVEAEAERRNLARRGAQMSQALLNEVLD
ncbi:MAG: TIGR02301 family protein [Alphaproteobacteria bacterium]|nr:TIGR02301 family protein [Alphaproteobacteria bacterium]